MDIAEALLVAEAPALYDMPTLWAALRVLAPIVGRVQAGADLQPQGMGDVDTVTVLVREANYYLTGDDLPTASAPGRGA